MRSLFSHFSIIKYLLFFPIVFFSTSSYTQSYFPPISGTSWDTLSPQERRECNEDRLKNEIISGQDDPFGLKLNQCNR